MKLEEVFNDESLYSKKEFKLFTLKNGKYDYDEEKALEMMDYLGLKAKKIIISIIIIILIILGLYFINSKFKILDSIFGLGTTEYKEKEEPKLQIVDEESNSRIIAVMINNNHAAWPHAGLQDAFLNYEIIVEGGITRILSLFKDADTEKIGSVRSARHYFLDYAMENDAIYAHLGMSPQAESDMKKFDIDSINGQIYDTGKSRTNSSLYWRVKHKNAPHNAYTNTSSILKISQDKGYRTTSDKESVLKYVTEEVNLESTDSQIANIVTIPYATNHKVQYKYNSETKRYTRYSKNRKMVDETTNEDITTKNIIITFARNYTLNDGENKGRQDVVTVGELDGYYITNGKAIKIKCIKTDRTEQTTYVDLNGNEISVNDGNTWVNICPLDASVTISE